MRSSGCVSSMVAQDVAWYMRAAASAVPAQAFTHPCRWSFGDGSSAAGISVRHVYHRAREYRVTVTAYYASYGAWYEFDNTLLRVRG